MSTDTTKVVVIDGAILLGDSYGDSYGEGDVVDIPCQGCGGTGVSSLELPRTECASCAGSRNQRVRIDSVDIVKWKEIFGNISNPFHRLFGSLMRGDGRTNPDLAVCRVWSEVR